MDKDVYENRGMGVSPMRPTGVSPVTGREHHGLHGRDGRATHGQDARATGEAGLPTWSRTYTRLAAAAVLLLASGPAVAAVEVASIFGAGMVLQRDAAAPIWGRAAAGEKVTVTFGDQSKAAVADQAGRWSVSLGPMPASSRPRPLVMTGAGRPVTFENVRVGEVWLVLSAGRLGRQYSTEGPVPNDETRVIAFDGGRENYSLTPQESFGRNTAWGPDRRQQLDVLSIRFANRLNEALGVPVGIVRVNVGDLDATIPPQGFAAVASLADISRRVDTWYPSTKRGKAAYTRWLAEMKQWQQAMAAALESGGPVRPSQPPLAPGPAPGDASQPTVVFNRQLNPLVPFAFAGVLHVHDVAPNEDAACSRDVRYADKMRALIAGLRAAFGRADLPFAFSQRNEPNIYHAHTAGGKDGRDVLNFDAWLGHRDRQRRVLPAKNVGMVVTADVENYPSEVGERFARWALSVAYGREQACSGPIYKGHRAEGDHVVIEFDHADGGLMAAGYPEVGRPLVEQKGGAPRFFAVAGADRIFHRAEARIEGKTVVARSDKVAKPVAVRYACHFDPRGMNLYNRAGLPASPFRTDDWPMGDLDGRVEQLKAISVGDLVKMLGYPTMPHSHAAARALAGRGEATVLPIVKRLLADKDPDLRCGGLRTLGYLYWMGPIPRGSAYYGQEPQEVTAPIARAIEMIGKAAGDGDPLVRRCAAEALSLIGSENEALFAIVSKLAVDSDALVRTAAMRLAKYRLNAYAHNTALAYAVLQRRPFGDRISTALAGNLLNHQRLNGPIDMGIVGRFLLRIGPGQGSDAVGDLGDMLRRIKGADGAPSLNEPGILPGVLHLYALGYRNYMLYGVERWIALKKNVRAFRGKIDELKTRIQQLRRDKPAGWEDLSRRYADAIDGLEALIEQSSKARR